MQTRKDFLLDLLGMPKTSFVIPAYQRLYSWKERQCRELWLDVHRAARANASHFVGTVLYSVEEDDAQGARRLAVIDGQQRLTTLTLMLVALARHLAATGASLPDAAGSIDAAGIAQRFLKAGDGAHASAKLVLSRNDRPTLETIVEGSPLPQHPSERVVENLALFESLMAEDSFGAATLWAGLNRLFVIDAEVGAGDNAQLIFESLNSKGKPLTTADLVRNYLLLAESHDEQTRLYDEYWAPIEGSVRFRKVRAKGAGEVYSVFKQYVEDEFDGTPEDLLAELRGFCMVWAENYRYHAVKKYKSAFKWARNGAPTLVSHYKKKPPANASYAEKVRRERDAVDPTL